MWGSPCLPKFRGATKLCRVNRVWLCSTWIRPPSISEIWLNSVTTKLIQTGNKLNLSTVDNAEKNSLVLSCLSHVHMYKGYVLILLLTAAPALCLPLLLCVRGLCHMHSHRMYAALSVLLLSFYFWKCQKGHSLWGNVQSVCGDVR